MNQIALLPYVKAAAHLYGVYHVQDLINMIKHYENVEYSRKDMQTKLGEVIKLDENLRYVGTYVIDLRHFPKEEIAIAFYKKNKQKPFYYPTMEELGRYINQDYIDIRKEHRAMAQFIEQHTSASQTQIAHVMRKVLEKIQGEEEMRSIMEELLILGRIPDSEMPVFASLLEGMMNHTRRFCNHGYTPEELRTLAKQETI